MTCDILLLCEFPTLNGGEQSLLSTLPVLQSSGLRLKVAAPSHGPFAQALYTCGVEVIPFSMTDEQGSKLSLIAARALLQTLLQQHAPRLLHANSLSMSRLSGPVAQWLNLRSLGHLRDIMRLKKSVIDDLNQHHRLIAVSHAVRDYHVQQGLSVEKTLVLHNGVNLQTFRPRPPNGWLHDLLNLPTETYLAGCIGQLILRKGQDTLVEAAIRLAPNYPLLHWIILGERHSSKAETVDFEANLHGRLQHAGIEQRVHFLGVRSDIAALLPELTFLVHPARQEPLGRVLLEAAACCLPVIATHVGGTCEIFGRTDSSTCAAKLISPDDIIQLAQAVKELIEAPSLRVALGQKARQQAEEKFNVQITAAKLMQLYESSLPT